GHVEVFIQPLAAGHLRLLEMLESERPATLLTDLDSGEVEVAAGARGSEPSREGSVFVEPFPRTPRMIIVGAIHIAIPLHRLARLMGYRVTVVDARPKFATAERFPEADEVLVKWPDEALEGMEMDASSFVVILTHDPKFDLPALRSVLGRELGYLGAIGSRKTNANRLQKLRQEGFAEEALARVHGPIGLDLGGRGAEETALAIMAEVTAARHGASGGSLRASPGAVPAS
ncbi:MAG: XdhC family protein, partial [Candidatus Dormibacterales bacterium]